MIVMKRIITITLIMITLLTLILTFNNIYSIDSAFSINSINQISNPQTVQSSPNNTTFLPRTNLTVTNYYKGNPGQRYNASVLSLDSDNWYIHCEYFINSTKEIIPFDTIVNRTSANCVYPALNYYSWEFTPSPFFDFWLNASEFYLGYKLNYGEFTLTVAETEIISLVGIGNFNVWKLTGPFNSILWIDMKSGMFISFYFEFVGSNWYNLTKADFGQIEPSYSGPVLFSISPSNNTEHPNETTVELEFASPYSIHTIYYQWDNGINLSVLSPIISTVIPSFNGEHHLNMSIIDSLGYRKLFHFVFQTNDKLPRILVNYKNNSRIQSTANFIVSVVGSNDSFYYSWDEGSSNPVNSESSMIDIPSSEGTHTLNISAMSGVETDLWYIKRFVFIVDNTPPNLFIYDPDNRSVLKGTVNIYFVISEQSNLTYKLNNEIYDSFIANKDQLYLITFSDLLNGSYTLNITAYDEALNPVTAILLFEVYTSAFNWIWELEANIPRRINVSDANNTTWFFLTVLSISDQNFTINVHSEETSPKKTDDMIYAIKFDCDNPNDILFLTVSFPLIKLENFANKSFDVYQWVYWDSLSNKWIEIPTSYNAIFHSWDATFEGFIEFFGLLKTGNATELKSIEPGGGQIPSFGFGIAIIALIGIVILNNKRKD